MTYHSNNFELSLDNITFQTSIILEPNKLKNVYVRFSPTELGNNTGNINPKSLKKRLGELKDSLIW